MIGSVALVFIFAISSFVGTTKIVHPSLKQHPTSMQQEPKKAEATLKKDEKITPVPEVAGEMTSVSAIPKK